MYTAGYIIRGGVRGATRELAHEREIAESRTRIKNHGPCPAWLLLHVVTLLPNRIRHNWHNCGGDSLFYFFLLVSSVLFIALLLLLLLRRGLLNFRARQRETMGTLLLNDPFKRKEQKAEKRHWEWQIN